MYQSVGLVLPRVVEAAVTGRFLAIVLRGCRKNNSACDPDTGEAVTRGDDRRVAP
jgi:hypothetical protein